MKSQGGRGTIVGLAYVSQFRDAQCHQPWTVLKFVLMQKAFAPGRAASPTKKVCALPSSCILAKNHGCLILNLGAVCFRIGNTSILCFQSIKSSKLYSGVKSSIWESISLSCGDEVTLYVKHYLKVPMRFSFKVITVILLYYQETWNSPCDFTLLIHLVNWHYVIFVLLIGLTCFFFKQL